MRINYQPNQRKIPEDAFGVEPLPEEWPEETWPNCRAPIIRGETGQRAADGGHLIFPPRPSVAATTFRST